MIPYCISLREVCIFNHPFVKITIVIICEYDALFFQIFQTKSKMSVLYMRTKD